MNPEDAEPIFPSAREEARAARRCEDSPQTLSPSYRLAYDDADFLASDEMLAVRLQLELTKADSIQRQLGVRHTMVVFGSTRIPDPTQAQAAVEAAAAALAASPEETGLQRRLAVARRIQAHSRYHVEARRLAALVARQAREQLGFELVIATGGGPGIMEAANQGAYEAGARSIGLNIVLPYEQSPNRYITPDLCFQFHYFAIRKMHFLLRARALVAFPGGFGTLDELFDALTLIQTGKVAPIPVLLFGRDYWEQAVGWDYLMDQGTIAERDRHLFHMVETAEEAFEHIAAWYRGHRRRASDHPPLAADREVPG